MPRDYELVVDDDGPTLVSIFGGKITTYRILAETVMRRLRSALDISAGPWTEHASLPGGDIPGADYAGFLEACRRRYPMLDPGVLEDYARNYGTAIETLVGERGDMEGLGRCFGDGLYEAELRYLMEYEWAETAEDALWRRSKKGLRLQPAQIADVSQWMEQQQRQAG